MQSRFARIRKHPMLFSLLAGLLLLAAQTAAEMHGVDHLFHKSVESCAAYHSVEHHKPGVFGNLILLAVDCADLHHRCRDYSNPETPILKTWHSRAPPKIHPV